MLPRPCEVIDPQTGQWHAAKIIAEDPALGYKIDSRPGDWYRHGSSQVRTPNSGAAAAVATPAAAAAAAPAVKIAGAGSVPRPCEVMKNGQWKRANITAEDPINGVQTDDTNPGSWHRHGSSTVREVASGAEELPEGWLKVASQSRPGEFSYQNKATGEKVATLAQVFSYQAVPNTAMAGNLPPGPDALGYTRGSVNLHLTPSSLGFRVGETVEFFSASLNKWITTAITQVRHETDEVEVGCKIGAWISTADQLSKLRYPQRSSPAKPAVAQAGGGMPTMAGGLPTPPRGANDVSVTMQGAAAEAMINKFKQSEGSAAAANMSAYMENDKVQIWRENIGSWVDGIIVKDSAFGCQGPDGEPIPAGSVFVKFNENGIRSKWIPPCSMGLLRRKDAAPQRLKCSQPSRAVLEIIEESDMAFLRVRALRKLKSECRTLPRKQDLATSGLDFVKGSGAVAEWMNIDSEYPSVRIFITSHPWFDPKHPDPTGAKLFSLLRELEFVGATDEDLVFIDFSGLPQRPRSGRDEGEFGSGLSGMNELYMTERSEVLLVPDVPQDASNSMPYEKRGWCHFELSIAKLAGRIANQATYDKLVNQAASADAMESLFETGKLTFTNGGDKDHVVTMLKKIQAQRYDKIAFSVKSVPYISSSAH